MKKAINAFRSSIVILVVFCSISVSAEIAVIPYRVQSESQYLTEENGRDYAFLVSLGASLTRKVEVLPWSELDNDLKRAGIKPGRKISGEQLASFGKSRYLKYIVTGTLERSDRLFRSSGILYSVTEDRIVARSKNSAGDLATLAERDMADLFLHFPKKTAKAGGAMDVAIVFDSSLSMRKDWNSLKEGVCDLSSYAMEQLAADARISLVPYSDHTSAANVRGAVKSVHEVQEFFGRIRPLGDSEPAHLADAMRYAVNSIRWRDEAARFIIVVANSPSRKGSAAERYSLTASKKGIRVCSVTMGALGEDAGALYRRMADMGNGTSYAVSYHQRIYDEQGAGHELYFQRGRFFRSSVFSSEWKDGLLRKENSTRAYGEPLRFLDEIFFRESGLAVNAYNMPDSLKKSDRVAVLRSEGLEDNIPRIMRKIVERYGTPKDDEPQGKVLLSDGKMSLWIRPSDRQIIARLKEYAGSGVYLNLGCTVRSAPGEPHGITLLPRIVMAPGDYLPESLRANLDEVVRNREAYTGKGFLSPPLWFIRLKVDRLENFRETPDVRD